jgi:3-oxoadipate enol-lactonase
MSAVTLHHVEQGQGPAVLLSPSLGTTLEMWDDLAERLASDHRVIRFDTRGHGGSPVPPGPYTVSELADDVVALADSLELDRFAFVGLSLGGAIGQVLALEHPARLTALVLCCTGPSFGDPSAWRDRGARVRAEGMGWLVEPTRSRWFTPEFAQQEPQQTDRLLAQIAATPPEGYAACCDALAAYDVTLHLPQIGTPTRVIAGAEDPVSPPEVARVMEQAIPGADLVVLDGASHIANVARPDAFNAAVQEHLRRHA